MKAVAGDQAGLNHEAKIYTDMADFFLLRGSVAMRLSPDVAVTFCRSAAVNGLVVSRVKEGFDISGI